MGSWIEIQSSTEEKDSDAEVVERNEILCLHV
jgi:hypothetical protein